MPNKSAGKKYLKVSLKNKARNFAVKAKMKEVVKKVRIAIKESGATEKAAELLKEAERVIDRAAQKKVIKKNTASRKKSRLHKSLKSAKK